MLKSTHIISSLKPLVSICCITYNHKNYIRDAIEGFLQQKTTFPIEIIIHDDASNDGTADIIKSYALKLPELIIPIYQNENQYSKNSGSMEEKFVWPYVRGKYIALCEGDDYWTDPFKLQKQLDFLEENPEYSMCFHGARIINEINNSDTSLFMNLRDKDYTSDELIGTWTVPTASIFFRKEFVSLIPQSKKFMFEDIILILTMAERGKIRCINELMSVYRRTSTGALLSQTKNYSYYIRRAEHYKEISGFFPKISKTTIDKLIIDQYVGICLSYIKQLNLKQFLSNYLKFFKEYRFAFIKSLILSSFNSSKLRIRKLINPFT